MSGFNLADAFVQIHTKDDTKDSVNTIIKRVQGIDDKIVDVKADDLTAPILSKIDAARIDDKTVGIKAHDDATAVIDKVDSEQPDEVVVPVTAEDKTPGVLAGIGGSMKNWAMGLGLGVAGVLTAALATGIGQANIITGFENQMGVTTDVAAHYGEVAGHVFGKGFAKDKDIVSDAINALSSDMKGFGDLATDEQERIAGKAVKVASNFGDINTVMQAASNMVSNDVAGSFDEAFDVITKGMQNAGSRGEDLLETFREYPGFLKQLGLNGSESIDLLNKMMQAGAQDTDKAADALKEFTILAVESGGTASQAYKTLGMDAEAMARAIASGGPAAKDAFLQTVQALQSVQDPAKRAQLAVQLFGTMSEDTMTRLLPKLDLGKLGMDNVAGATDRLKSTLTPMEQLTNSFSDAMAGLTPIIVPVVKVIGGIANVLGEVAKGIDNVLKATPKNDMPLTEVFKRMKDVLDDGESSFGNWSATVRSIMNDLNSNAIPAAEKLGFSFEDLTGAVAGNQGALEKWNGILSRARESHAPELQALEDLNSGMGAVQRESDRASDELAKVGEASAQSADGTNKQADASKSAAGAIGQQTAALTSLQDAILGSINKDIAYRQSVSSTKDAQKELADTLKKHKPTSQEAQDATLALESAQVRQAQAARDSATANSHAADDAGKAAEGAKVYAREVVAMAQASNGNGTPAIRQMVTGLSDAELAASGATRTIDAAGNAVIRLPGGKEIKVSADDNASWRIQQIADKDYKAYITVYPELKNVTQALSQGRFAEGGPIVGPGTGTSDEIPIMASNGEYMIKASVARRPGVRQLLDSLNSGEHGIARYASGGPVGDWGSGQPMAQGDTYVMNIHAPPDMDIVRLAAMISRQQEIQRRNRK